MKTIIKALLLFFNRRKKLNIVSCAVLLLSITFHTVCRGKTDRPSNGTIDQGLSSIAFTLEPHQKFHIVSDFDEIFSFENTSDTIKTIVKHFSFDKIKEFRTLDEFPEILILQPHKSLLFSLVNNKPYGRNDDSKWAIATRIIERIGYKYIMSFNARLAKTDTAFNNSFLTAREQEMNRDVIKVDALIVENKVDRSVGNSLILLRQITYATIILNSVDNIWLQKNKPEIFEKYYNMLDRINTMSGETVSFALSNMSWYWAKMHVKENLTWVDFYFRNKNTLGNSVIGKAFFDYLKNASNDHKQTELYNTNFLKILNYSKLNDSRLYNFAKSRLRIAIPSMDDIMLQRSSGEIVSLKKLLIQTKKEFILIDFWASWCKPCRFQTPYLKKIKKELTENNIAIVGISIDDSVNSWKKAIVEDHLGGDIFQVRVDKGNKKSNTINSFFDLESIPRYAFIDKHGKLIIFKTDFKPNEKEFKSEIINSIKSLIIN